MIKGITKNWKLPFSFYFSSGPTKSIQLQKIIEETTTCLVEANFNVLGFVCDQSATNVKTINELKRSSQISCLKNKVNYIEDTINIGNHTLLHFFDVPHLLKGIRNILLKGNIFWEEGPILKQANWQPIINFYNVDKERAIRACPKLTEEHVIPSKIKKMNVKKSAQVFSQRVSSVISLMADFGMYFYLIMSITSSYF